MSSHVRRASLRLGLASLATLFTALPAGFADAHGSLQRYQPAAGFVQRSGSELVLGHRPYRFAGANNYYAIYKSPQMVDTLFAAAKDSGLEVMRVWGSIDIGTPAGTDSVDGPKEGVYFQYWNGTAPAVNEGETGMKRLDYVISQARAAGIRLVIPFVNNWRDFGGMDQYVRWRGGQYHDDFYTDPQIREWYKAWIASVLNRINSYTGVRYKDDPTILTWELANEPRCGGSGVYPRSAQCTTQTLIDWAADVSAYVKRIDRNHLVSVGDEGFYCTPDASDWTENCTEGVDTVAFAKLPHIDVMSFHLYPENWGKDTQWGQDWIKRHVRDARRLRKAVMLGEFGLRDKSVRNRIYKQWTDTVLLERGNGALYWMLADDQDNGTPYPDYDGFTVYCPGALCRTISNFDKMMDLGLPLPFPPVADDDVTSTDFNTPATLTPLSNDVAYFPASLKPRTIDLDPSATGQQSSITVAGGTFTARADGTVAFAPTSGFDGTALGAYTVADSLGQRAKPAVLEVTVRPDPNAALRLFSFESGTQGWAPASWQANAGSTTTSTAFATDGSASLQIDSLDGGWFGVNLGSPVDLSGKPTLKLDLHTALAGSSTNVAVQLGGAYTWCQASWGWQNADTTATLSIDLASLADGNDSSLPCPALGSLNDVKAIWVFFSGGATYYLDHVRAE
jgi:mannan endo-1,4-beta-mannosidase